MNTPNPFDSKNSAAAQLKKSRARLRLAVFAAVGVGLLVLVPLLVQGCKREKEPAVTDVNTNIDMPTTDVSNLPPIEPVHTNVISLPPINIPPVTTNVPSVSSIIPPAASGSEYVVAKGDSFYTIAKKNSVSIKAVEDANPGVDPKKLKVGQKLTIPTSASAPAASGSSPTTAVESTDGEKTYTVKSGDTLTRIAKSQGSTVKLIKSENNLTTNKIKVGQKLKIPVKESAPVAAPVPPSAVDTSVPPVTPTTTIPTLPTLPTTPTK